MKCKVCGKESKDVIEIVDNYGKIMHGIEYKIPLCKECREEREKEEE